MDLTTVPDLALFEEGVNRFDDGRFWDAHESWEDLWNEMKRSGCHRMEILAIQGLIQTAALLLHHERRNLRGVLNQWKKLQPKLEAWQVIMGIDVPAHMRAIQAFVRDAEDEAWSLTASHHRLPRIDAI